MWLPAPRDRGIALPAAVFALVVVAALIAGAFFVSIQEQRLANSTRDLVRASGSAEAGLAELVGARDARATDTLSAYPAGSLAVGWRPTPLGTGSYRGLVYKLNDNLYLLGVTGADTARFGPGRDTPVSRLALIARARSPAVAAAAALTTRGALVVRDAVAIDGRDAIPNATWTGCAPAPDTAAILINGTLTLLGSAIITGTPPVIPDTTVGDTVFDRLGDVTYGELAARADVTLPSGSYAPGPDVVSGACGTGETNWGDGMDRSAPCGGRVPLVRILGDLTVTGGQGQGILLVDGDLQLSGPFRYFGVVLVRGALRVSDEGSGPARLWGALLVGNGEGATSELAGGAAVTRSTCAVEHAVRAAAYLAPLRSRGWARLF